MRCVEVMSYGKTAQHIAYGAERKTHTDLIHATRAQFHFSFSIFFFCFCFVEVNIRVSMGSGLGFVANFFTVFTAYAKSGAFATSAQATPLHTHYQPQDTEPHQSQRH